mmetsp:Transcript_6904/g.13662  ORF Transcript_6904/g.13662 Transcript_6904/m.13662 type:complete len:213 (-) Transcript_6904:32-670(-)
MKTQLVGISFGFFLSLLSFPSSSSFPPCFAFWSPSSKCIAATATGVAFRRGFFFFFFALSFFFLPPHVAGFIATVFWSTDVARNVWFTTVRNCKSLVRGCCPGTFELASRVPNCMALFCSTHALWSPRCRAMTRRMNFSPSPGGSSKLQMSVTGSAFTVSSTLRSRNGWRASLPHSERTLSSLAKLRSHSLPMSFCSSSLSASWPLLLNVLR